MIKESILLVLVALTTSNAQISGADSSDGGSGIVYGHNHAFAISAPKGWILDNASGVSQGLHAVFYPRGGSWEKSPVVMYANTSSKNDESTHTLRQLLAFDSLQFVSNQPKVQIVDSDSMVTGDNKSAFVRTFRYSQFEAVAYVDESTIVSMLVLTARTKRDFDQALPSFKELVSSYRFLTTDVKIDGK